MLRAVALAPHSSGVKLIMNKNNFRILVVITFILSVLAGVYDFIWPSEIITQISDYAYEIEPEYSDFQIMIVSVIAVLLLVCAAVSFVGLLLFKNWGRHLYIAGFIIAFPLYPFMGVSVVSGANQLIYDLAMVLSGVLIAVCYYSPISKQFTNKEMDPIDWTV